MMYGYGPGVISPGWSTTGRDLNLSTDNVKNYFEGWLAWQGNPRLKVGDVKEKDADTIVADIVTKDNSLVQRFVVNRRNGFFARAFQKAPGVCSSFGRTWMRRRNTQRHNSGTMFYERGG